MESQNKNAENQEQVSTETIESQEECDNIYTSEDIEKNKNMAGFSYFIFFLPLIACPDSKYARFHANQSLLLLITWIAGNILLRITPLGWMLMPIYGVIILVFLVIGFINGFAGKVKKFPIIGKFTIIK